MTNQTRTALIATIAAALSPAVAFAQFYDEPDRGQPGDRMVQEYLRRETHKLHAGFLQDVQSLDDWQRLRPKYKEQYLYMLGLSPLPEKTPLKATITGTLQGDGYVVDMLHYQSRPGLYVTGNLYRPANVNSGERLPAVYYACGHGSRGRNGNKAGEQSHGIWFARHGYLCLIVDSLQLGEIAAIHHGTKRYGRWWWHSRGYVPAGVECWNGIRGIDYLTSRDDVDPDRIAVTGMSGGGGATFWIAAADDRVRVAVPVSGMADLPAYVPNRMINGHCDCMFLYNTFQWPWTRIAGLIAPRPLLFVNSDQDHIFPMAANQRVINRLERLYSQYGAGDQVDAVVSVGGHAYRKDIRQAAFRFINMHLKNDPRIVTDSEVDLVTGTRRARNLKHPIEPQMLRVFPIDSDIPADQLNTTIDQHFVPLAEVATPGNGEFASWKTRLLAELRRVSFRWFPDRIPPAKLLESVSPEVLRLESEAGIEVRLELAAKSKLPGNPARVLLVVQSPESESAVSDWVQNLQRPNDRLYVCEPRGVGYTRWTQNKTVNYVERSLALLGRTVDAGRVWDVAAAARYLQTGSDAPVFVVGEDGMGIVAAYAALWEDEIDGVILNRPPSSHMQANSAQMLNVLRVCDIPDVLGMLAPRLLSIHGADKQLNAKVTGIYSAANATKNLVTQ